MFEDDHYRYLWDGFVTANGFNPFNDVPSYFFDKTLPSDIEIVLDAVSYPDMGSVYGGAAQYIFALCYTVAPGQLWPLKAIIFVVECVLLWLLYRRLSLSQFSLFAFCPLLIHSFSINLHVDILALLLAYIAMLAGPKKAWLAGAMLALACSIKLYAILLLPLILIKNLPKSTSIVESCARGLSSGVMYSFLLTFLLIEGQYLLSGGFALANIVQAGKVWAFNNPLFYLIYSFAGGEGTRGMMLLCFASWSLVVGYQYWRMRSRVNFKEGFIKQPSNHSQKYSIQSAAFIVFSGFIIFSPVVNPWYFSWALLFAAGSSSRQWWPWCAAITLWLSYITGINTGSSELGLYQVATPALILEWLIPLMTFFWFWCHRRESISIFRSSFIAGRRHFDE